MKDLPTLEENIIRIAEQKLDNDIHELHMVIYGEEHDDKYFQLLKHVSIDIHGENITTKAKLCCLFQDPIVINAIKQHRLSEYVQREIDALLNKS